MSAGRVFPPRAGFPRAFPLPSLATGASPADLGFTLIQSIEQGTTLTDPSNFCDVETFTPATGLWEWNTATHTSVVATLRAAISRGTVIIRDVEGCEDFDPAIHGLETMFDYTSPGDLQHPGASNLGVTVAQGVQDSSVIDANLQGCVSGVSQVGSSVTNSGILDTTGWSGATNGMAPVKYCSTIMGFIQAADLTWKPWRITKTWGTAAGSDNINIQNLSHPTSLRNDPSIWRFVGCLAHNSTNDWKPGGVTRVIKARLWVKMFLLGDRLPS